VVITDYYAHHIWIAPGANHYFVAHEKIAQQLIKKNISQTQITISGIPVDPIFYQDKPIDELKNKYQLFQERKNILLLSGGQGLIDISQAIKVLFRSNTPLNIIAIAGKNKKLENKLKKITVPAHIYLQTIGWTEAIDEYLRLADVVVTKPGGATIAECLALDKPIIIINPIPGPEERNADYLVSNGLAQIVRDTEDLLSYVENWPTKMNDKIIINNAAKIILEKIL
jgi:processive 1,2-diacylglycerol beta-glucosyltransferase